MAVANYHDREGQYPPAHVLGPDGRPWHSWRVLILPYIEGQSLFDAYRFNEPWDGPNNSRLADRMPKLFAFHDTKFPTSTTNYLAVVGSRTMWPGPVGRRREEVTDDLSQTILVVENNGLGVHWMEPRDLNFETISFELDRPDGVSSWYKEPAVATLGRNVRRLSKGMSPEALRAALTVDGGEPIGEGEGGWVVLADGRDRERVR